VILISAIAATGTIIFCVKILGLKNTLRFQIPIDLLTTILLPILFSGSFTGMTIAILTGVFITIGLLMLTFLANIKNRIMTLCGN
jgi:hypothetical protein